MALIEIRGFDNLGFTQIKFDGPELEPIKDEVRKIQLNFENAQKHNQFLAGNIRREYLLKDSKNYISELLYPFLLEYNDFHKNWMIETARSTVKHSEKFPKKIALEHAWVNFQKKYEFNPPHSHDGIISFVIWIQIPFLMQDELANSPGAESNTNIPGCFNFHFTNSLGELKNSAIHADKTMENTLLIFPAKMVHSVSPFYTSDEYRISVAGNFVVSTEN
jgi:Putative 2OG-Fe(II) oxygenase